MIMGAARFAGRLVQTLTISFEGRIIPCLIFVCFAGAAICGEPGGMEEGLSIIVRGFVRSARKRLIPV